MKVGEIVGEALDYPGTNLKKVLTLELLWIISFLLIPVFIALGYNLRVLKATIAGFDELPDFDEWGEMLIDGLKVFVVGLVYALIPAIIYVASIFLMQSNPIAGIIGLIIGFILLIIFGLVANIAVAHMAFNDSLGSAFSIGEILNVISEISWAKYIIWIIGVAIINTGTVSVSYLIASIVLLPITFAFGLTAGTSSGAAIVGAAIVFILATLIFLFVASYLQIFYSRALGRLYADR